MNRIVASLLVWAFPLVAQIVPALHRSPNGVDQVRIRNDFAQPAVAFVISVPRLPPDAPEAPEAAAARSSAAADAPLLLFSDPLIDSTRQPVAPGEERTAVGIIGPAVGPGRSHAISSPSR